jgi:hypothetical protein
MADVSLTQISRCYPVQRAPHQGAGIESSEAAPHRTGAFHNDIAKSVFASARARKSKMGAELIAVLGTGLEGGGLSSSSHPPHQRTGATLTFHICNSRDGVQR